MRRHGSSRRWKRRWRKRRSRSSRSNRRPMVGCVAFRESGIEYEVAYDLLDAAQYWIADSHIRVHVYAALLRGGFAISYPRRIVELRRDERPRITQREIDHRIAALGAIDLFASLTERERASLARELTTSAYVKNETVFRAGEPADSLYLLAQGRVEIVRERDRNARVKLAAARRPGVFRRNGTAARPAAHRNRRRRRRRTLLPPGQARIRCDPPRDDRSSRKCSRRSSPSARPKTMRRCRRSMPKRARDMHVSRTTDLLRRIQQFFGLRSSATTLLRSSPSRENLLAPEQEHAVVRRCRRQPDERHPRKRRLGGGTVVADLDDQQTVRAA